MTSTTPSLPEAVADVVRSEMSRLGVSIADVAAATGLSQAAVAARLNGPSPLTLEHLDAVAPLLGARSSDLIDAARSRARAAPDRSGAHDGRG